MPDINNKTTEDTRPTLTQCLVDRYNNQHVGGAYNAKTDVVTTTGDGNAISLAGNEGNTGYYDSKWTKTTGFKIGMQVGQTEQIDNAQNITRYTQGHSTRKYSRNSPHNTGHN